MDSTARLLLPLLIPGQAQKELFHNEALQQLDIVAAAGVEDIPFNDPPAAPAEGSCYLVGNAPSGEWANEANTLAGFTAGGWRHVAPLDGMTVWIKTSAIYATYNSGAWEIGAIRGSQLMIAGTKVVGAQANAIGEPAGGATVDAEARATLNAILDALRSHGLIASA